MRWRFVNNSELNDISTDPSETTDVSVSYPEVIDQLRKSYDVWWAATVPLMVNEGVTTQRVQRNPPLAVRYRKQLDEMGIADWNPHRRRQAVETQALAHTSDSKGPAVPNCPAQAAVHR